MAKKNKETVEEVIEAPNLVWVNELQEPIVEEKEKVLVVVEEVTPEVIEAPNTELSEEYNPKDIVEFYNNKGDLRYAPYAYITQRGYKALRKYTKKN